MTSRDGSRGFRGEDSRVPGAAAEAAPAACTRFSLRRALVTMLAAAVAAGAAAGCARRAPAFEGAAVLGGRLSNTAAGSPAARAIRPAPTPSNKVSDGEKELGIRIVFLRLSGGGRLVEMRYEVVDPEKAALIATGRVNPILEEASTGRRFLIPMAAKVGMLRQKTQEPGKGRHHFALFANPGGYVRAGSDVNIVVGETRIVGLKVE